MNSILGVIRVGFITPSTEFLTLFTLLTLLTVINCNLLEKRFSHPKFQLS